MKKSFIPILLPAVLFLATCCTARIAERATVVESTTLSAYMADAISKTGYVVDNSAGKAVFNWLKGDKIDVAVNTGSTYTPVCFVSTEAGAKATFTDASSEPTVASVLASNPGASLSDWAFYPSRSDEAAQAGYKADWSISGSDITVSLPSVIKHPVDNPLAVVPMMGFRDTEGDYAFYPMTAVLAIPVTNVTSEMDFISISSESAAFSGPFSVSSGAITQDGAQDGASGSLTLSFTGITGDYTFYFPVPSGTIPAGLKLVCGKTGAPEKQMTIVTNGPITLTHGHIARTQAIPFKPEEEAWTLLGTARFVDDMVWKASSFPPFAVPVKIWKDASNAYRYRMENPYTVAISAFKHASNGDGSQYMYLTVNPSNNQVTFGNTVTGMGKDDFSGAGTKNLAIADAPTWESIKVKGGAISAASSKVALGTATAPQEIQLYSVYYDSADITYYFTNNTGIKHIYFPAYYEAETWSDYVDGIFQDDLYDTKINNSVGDIGKVRVTIQQSSLNANRYRIANPYRGAVPSSILCSTYDEYLYFECSSSGSLVHFDPFRPGLVFDKSPRELFFVHPTYLNLNYPTLRSDSNQIGNSTVMETKADGSPLKVQLAPFYYDIATPDTGYNYPRHTSQYPAQRIFITFATEDKVIVNHYGYPLKGSFHNPIASLSIPNGTLEKMVVKVSGNDFTGVKGVRLWQNAQGGWMDSDYLAPGADGTVTMTSFTKPTVSGDIDLNFWIDGNPLGKAFRFDIQEVVVSGVSYGIEQDNTVTYLGGVIVNTGGDKVNVRGSEESVSAFRIPALVTSKDGTTLLAAYDVRYKGAGDLQADIDVGMKRSTDGGKTWLPLQIIMDMGTYGGLTEAENGIGDPCLLVDDNTGRIFCFAVWTHGHAGGRALSWAGTGFEIADTPQYMMVYSDDNGATWCDPINITTQVKEDAWRMTFQGPGRGFTKSDGTLIVPMQHQTSNGALNSGIMYSTDHGTTWHTHNYARATTSECTAIELNSGAIMLNMRDETGSKKRAVYVTSDLGQTWTKHSTDATIIEPTCEACLLKVKAADNILGKDIVLFSNPHDSADRKNMTIQASLDDASTWTHSLMVDGGGGWGYSCLTMIDNQTVGILYESSRANIYFQAVPLTEIIK